MRREGALRWGALAGFVGAALLLPLGTDGGQFLRAYGPDAIAPAWTYFLLAPLAALRWPLDYAALVALTVLGIYALCWAAGVSWHWVIVSVPAVYVVWLGQAEGLVVWGVCLAWLVVQERMPVGWGGLAVLLLLVKPQAGGLLALYLVWCVARRGPSALFWLAVPPTLALILTGLTYGPWLGGWLAWLVYRAGAPSVENLGLGLYGLPALLLALEPGLARENRMRLLLVANALIAPYIQHYSYLPLMAATGLPLVAVLSWMLIALRLGMDSAWWLLWIPVLAGVMVWRNCNAGRAGRGWVWQSQPVT